MNATYAASLGVKRILSSKSANNAFSDEGETSPGSIVPAKYPKRRIANEQHNERANISSAPLSKMDATAAETSLKIGSMIPSRSWPLPSNAQECSPTFINGSKLKRVKFDVLWAISLVPATWLKFGRSLWIYERDHIATIS